MRILITGGAGYLGSVLAQKLAENSFNKIFLVDNFFYGHWHVTYPWVSKYKNIEIIDKDIVTNSLNEYISKSDIIYHLAALVGAPRCEVNRDLTIKTNYDAVINLVKILSKEQILVFPDSNSGLGTVCGVAHENTPRNPLSLYASTKQKAGEYVLENHALSVVFSLATLYGVSPRLRLDLLVNSLAYEAFFTEKIELFEANANRNYVSVHDVADCFSQIPDFILKMAGNLYCLGNDEINMNKGKLAEKIKNVIPCQIVPIDKEDFDKRNYLVSSKKLFESIGFKASRPLEQDLRELSDYYNKLPRDKNIREKVCSIMRNI